LLLLIKAINVNLGRIDKEHILDFTISVENKILQYITNNCIHEKGEIKSGIQQGLSIYKYENINKWMVKGRIETRKPVLFQLSKSIFIKRQPEHFHLKNLHGTSKSIAHEATQVAWSKDIKLQAKQIVRDCSECARYNKNPENQMMASLPEFRTTMSPPFTFVAIDFVGPLEYLTGSLKKEE
jgi:hypothetical protein